MQHLQTDQNMQKAVDTTDILTTTITTGQRVRIALWNLKRSEGLYSRLQNLRPKDMFLRKQPQIQQNCHTDCNYGKTMLKLES